jgi:nucleoside phosphorylase
MVISQGSRPADTGVRHTQRKEIARYLLSRGLDAESAEPVAERMLINLPGGHDIDFPEGLEPTPQPLDSAPSVDDPLPPSDVVVITWTVDEVAGLAHVLTPKVSADRWYRYARNFETYRPKIRPYAPAAQSQRLGSYLPTRVGSTSVLCMKSELHLNQDGVKTGDGTATLPVKDFFHQIIDEAHPKVILTIGTAGSVFEKFGLGDVVVTRGAKFRLADEFRNEAFNGASFTSNWTIPTSRIGDAAHLMRTLTEEITEPPFAPPTKRFPHTGLLTAPGNNPQIRLDDGHVMPEFHPILTTDYFEYGTSANRLDKEGAAVEMGDAVLGMACSELAEPPNWAVVRNMSDPCINGDLPTKQFPLNEQTTWAVAYYTAYGKWTSTLGALTTWGIIAGLDGESAEQ